MENTNPFSPQSGETPQDNQPTGELDNQFSFFDPERKLIISDEDERFDEDDDWAQALDDSPEGWENFLLDPDEDDEAWDMPDSWRE